MHSLWWRRSCVTERRGERRYTDKQKPMTVDGRGGEGSGGEAGSMEDDYNALKAEGSSHSPA